MGSVLENLDLAYKADAAAAMDRMHAWWHRAILDRPAVQVMAPQSKTKPMPKKHHPTLRARWMDVEYAVACADVRMANTFWGGEIFPAFCPNLGPDVLAACLGAELEFGERTSWSRPCLADWRGLEGLHVRKDNAYLETILALTRQGLQCGKGKFLVGLTDLHPGGDLAAALRDPQQLCMDLVDAPGQVHVLLKKLQPFFMQIYEYQHGLLRDAGQEVTTAWLPLVSEGRYYISSNDFSCMVSPDMFREFFLPGLMEEMTWLDRAIYHLDGPGALKHLDALLDIEALDGVQFVYGAAHGPASRWMHVYRRIQSAGKNVHVTIAPEELDDFMASLKPEGVMLCTRTASVAEAEAVVRKIAGWTG